jgi:phosphohistidine swiveling domain-containing protein
MSLPPLPSAPAGVRYALTVPQSVLFADVSLRGSRREAFEAVFGTDFELDYIVIDDGAMSWDFSGEEHFAQGLFGVTDATVCVRRFIAAMGATARAVEKTSWMLASNATRRSGSAKDVLADLREYWNAYELHMTSLFTFWNVEELLSDALTRILQEGNLHGEIESGLERFLVPSETNYFALERRGFERIAARFGSGSADKGELSEAIESHVAAFGFLLAPFNLGKPPSAATLSERLEEGSLITKRPDVPLVDGRPDLLADIPEPIRELGLLAQELTFWKTERLDVMALADSRAADLYREAAAALSLNTDQLFAMKRDEIDSSLAQGSSVVSAETLAERRAGYCLLLRNGEVGFYEPTQQPASPEPGMAAIPGQLRGTTASPGVVSGRVRRVMDLSEAPLLEAGEILVTPMTRPEYGVALDRAAAFVTDEGGRMCHAAIIAREMKKPCVIGTGQATRLLQDGMVVTVDGESGVVTVDDGSAT